MIKYVCKFTVFLVVYYYHAVQKDWWVATKNVCFFVAHPTHYNVEYDHYDISWIF